MKKRNDKAHVESVLAKDSNKLHQLVDAIDDDDDNFVDPSPKRTKHTSKSTFSSSSTDKKPFVEYIDKKLKARVGAINIKNCVQTLSEKQEEALGNIGFAGYLTIDIETIPTRLAYWLVSNYDPERNELNLGNHIVNVNEEKVHAVLGIPMGKISIVGKNKPRNSSSKTIKIWKSQFKHSRIKVVNVCDAIERSNKGDYLFKLNWLVLHNTVLGWTTKCTTVNKRFLSSIGKESDIPKINWCEYLISCLNKTRLEWNGYEAFNGPVLFLAVLYVHEKRLRFLTKPQPTPTVGFVSNKYVIELDEFLYENGPLTDNEEDIGDESGRMEHEIRVDDTVCVNEDNEDLHNLNFEDEMIFVLDRKHDPTLCSSYEIHRTIETMFQMENLNDNVAVRSTRNETDEDLLSKIDQKITNFESLAEEIVASFEKGDSRYPSHLGFNERKSKWVSVLRRLNGLYDGNVEASQLYQQSDVGDKDDIREMSPTDQSQFKVMPSLIQETITATEKAEFEFGQSAGTMEFVADKDDEANVEIVADKNEGSVDPNFNILKPNKEKFIEIHKKFMKGLEETTNETKLI